MDNQDEETLSCTTTELRQCRIGQSQVIPRLHPDIHLERHSDQAHVLTLGLRNNRGSIPRGTGRDTSVLQDQRHKNQGHPDRRLHNVEA